MSLLLEESIGLIEYEEFEDDEREFGPMSADSSALAFEICSKIDNHARSKGMGRACSEVKIKLPDVNGNKKPDGIYVSREQWPINRPIPRTNAWEVLPDICIEVVSPTDFADELQDKIGEYFQAGVRQVWVAYPVQEQVFVYDSPTAVRILGRSGTLSGGDIIPGLELPLADLFPDYIGPTTPN